MDIFIGNVPHHATDKNLQKFFRPMLHSIGINSTFTIYRLGRKPCAILTILEREAGELILQNFGTLGRSAGRFRPRQQLYFGEKPLRLQLSDKTPDQAIRRTLEKEAKDRKSNTDSLKLNNLRLKNREKSIEFTSISYGQWDYIESEPYFFLQDTFKKSGNLQFAKTKLILETKPLQKDQVSEILFKAERMEIAYYTIQSMVWDSSSASTDASCISLTLSEAPRTFEQLRSPLESLGLIIGPQTPTWDRRSGISATENNVIGSCLAYRIQLSKGAMQSTIRRISQHNPKIPQYVPLPVYITHTASFVTQMDALNSRISRSYSHFEFLVRFQIQRLTQNGYLTPNQTNHLLPAVNRVLAMNGQQTCADALRRMSRQIPFQGPEQAYSEFELQKLTEYLEVGVVASEREGFYKYEEMKRNIGIRLIHRVMVTPSGVYLEGPEPEPVNRVVRQHSAFPDHFLRVIFCDDDFEPLRFSKAVNLTSITHCKFKDIMDNGIEVGGRHFDFLGFSHSSLKTQSAWFMSPISEDGKMINARMVVSRLGDFSEFRCPAKCAARIGQAFTDTSSSIPIDPLSIKILPDVERNGRCFSDGVGTVSQAIIERLWDSQPISGSMKPLLYQIRHAGAKGMVALDSRLEGEVLNLRPSMIKFKSTSTDLEVCGAATRPQTMHLNKQYIKILEDLGVSSKSFIDLQTDAVDRLRRVTANPINASVFIERERVCQAAQTPSLIRRLYYDGFDFREDPFLRGVVEVATLARLREIKYRARIIVENGVTLYGIMDETKTLQESQIYCSADGRIITGRVLVTRPPALHPGDAQMVTAVTVPDSCPLKDLDNCIVFSQQGERDLPSQLSGGDLDGDTFNVIWDKRLLPPRTVVAADYPRVPARELDRPVSVKDMTDFFIDFLQNDQLGIIATRHVQVADLLGSDHPDCLKLAEMHSTAVDFSKTGVPVDMKQLPRCSSAKPDFMAPSPRAIIENQATKLSPEEMLNGIDSEDSDSEALDPTVRSRRYYESTCVLGKLYRRIDEREFLDNVHLNYQAVENDNASKEPMMSRVWDHVLRENQDVEWEHLREWATDVKELYESQLMDTLYQFSWSPSENITELEVFVGTVLGRDGAMVSRRMRDMNKDMKEKFTHDVGTAVSSIRKGSEGEDPEQIDTLPRAIACLAVAIDDEGSSKQRRLQRPLQSFKYVAASLCLAEMHKQAPEQVVWRGRTAARGR